MDRREITAAVVEQTDRLLAEGIDHAVIAARLGITEYVVGVIDGDKLGKGRSQPQRPSKRRQSRTNRGVDAATIRMIQRMLQVGILNHGEIAREAHVSSHIVEQVASGRRAAVSTDRPVVLKDLGERFLPKPIRCSGCRAKISIVPCRACRANGVGADGNQPVGANLEAMLREQSPAI